MFLISTYWYYIKVSSSFVALLFVIVGNGGKNNNCTAALNGSVMTLAYSDSYHGRNLFMLLLFEQMYVSPVAQYNRGLCAVNLCGFRWR